MKRGSRGFETSIRELSQHDYHFLVLDEREMYSKIYKKVYTAGFSHWGNVIFRPVFEGETIEINASVLEHPYKGRDEMIKITIITPKENPEYYL